MYKKLKLNANFIYFIVALTFLGYYAILLIVHNLGLLAVSRIITIPTRLLILFFCFGLIFNNIRLLKSTMEQRLFILFSLAYIARVILDEINYEPYFLPSAAVMLYFIGFVVIPFIAISAIRYYPNYDKYIIRSLIISGFFFSFLVIYYYSNYIGSSTRGTDDETMMSPLALSYSSALILGTFPLFINQYKLSFVVKVIAIITFLLSFIPLFLGASRGSFFAIFVPYLILLIARNNVKHIIYGVILIVFFLFVLYNLQDYLGTSFFDRVLRIEEDVEKGSSSAARTEIWKTSFNQFLSSPFIGDKMRLNFYSGYPHNIIFESLQNTGFIGSIPLFALLASGMYKSYQIFKKHFKYAWVAIIFIQGLLQNMFSGAIWGANWLFTSLALLTIIYHYLEEKDKTKLSYAQK